MELEFEGQCIPCMRWSLYQVKNQEQTLEVRLSDGMPDIGSVLGAWGQCVLRGKEWRTESIGITGGVMVWVLYQPAEGGAPQSLEAWIPFQEKWELEDSQREGSIRTKCLLRNLDARMVSQRKLILRAGLGLLAEAMEPWEACIYAPVSVPEDVQLLQSDYPVMLPRESGERSFTLDEDLSLPDMSRLLYCRVHPRLSKQQVVGDKITFEGTAQCHLLYETTDGALNSKDMELEFSQLADLDQSYDKDAMASVMMELSSLEPEVQEGRIRMKCGLVGQYLIWDKRMLSLTSDAYSPLRSVKLQNRELQIPAALDCTDQDLRTEAVLNIPCSKVVDLSLMPEHPMLRRAGDLAEVEIPGSVQVLYYDPEGNLRCGSGRWNAQWDLPADSSVQIHGSLLGTDDPQVIPAGDQLTISTQLHARALSMARQGVSMVSGMSLGDAAIPDPGRPSLIMRPRGELSLWELAKECGSTVQAIYQANGLQEEPAENRLLLIPT